MSPEDEPVRFIPAPPFPEMTFLAPDAVPPITLFDALLRFTAEKLLGTALVPAAFVPTKLP